MDLKFNSDKALKNPSAPCKDCEERCPGCHSKCEAYKAFRTELDSTRASFRFDYLASNAEYYRRARKFMNENHVAGNFKNI